MKDVKDAKALFIIINAGFVDEVMGIARAAGAGGATIINARGEGHASKSILGITVDSEKEILLMIVNGETAKKVMQAVQDKAGIKTPVHGISFLMPVDQMMGITRLGKV